MTNRLDKWVDYFGESDLTENRIGDVLFDWGKDLAEASQQRKQLLAALERAEQTVRNLAMNIPPGKEIAQIARNEAANLRADIAAAKG